MAEPILYSFRRCPYAMRARLALAVAQQPVILREVDLKNKPSELLDASPKGTVPVVVLPDGTVIEQSLDIMRWALEKNDPEGWLTLSPEESSACDALLAFNDGPFKKLLDRYKYPSRYEEVHDSKAGIETALDDLEQRLEKRGFLLANKPKLADAALFPFIRQCAGVEPEWWTTAPFPRLRAWLGYWEGSALYARVMEKHDPWQPLDSPVRLFG